jgi:hydrogenase nickel incorporation protein HypB
LNKVDLLPVTDFSMNAFTDGLRQVTQAPLFPLSARTGAGLGTWISWIQAQREAHVMPKIA